MAKIVVVEDDAELAAAIAARLRSDAHCVTVAQDGPSAVRLAASARPDAVVLDLMLPGFDGLGVCRRIQRDCPVPVIMLTARGSETDRVVGLEVGADDYLCKPFSMRELTARVRALLRRAERSARHPGRVLRAGGVEIDVSRRRARLDGQLVGLTATEFDLLVYLLLSPGVVRTRDELLAEVWGTGTAQVPARSARTCARYGGKPEQTSSELCTASDMPAPTGTAADGSIASQTSAARTSAARQGPVNQGETRACRRRVGRGDRRRDLRVGLLRLPCTDRLRRRSRGLARGHPATPRRMPRPGHPGCARPGRPWWRTAAGTAGR